MKYSSDLFNQALQAEGITGGLAELARSIYQQESGAGANTGTSNRGAVGGMQIIPATFDRMADKGWDINNPEHNVRSGLRYLKRLDGLTGGDSRLTAAGYYGGEGAIAKARRGEAAYDPVNRNAPNTLQYADQVVARLPAKGGTGAPVQSDAPQAPVVASSGQVGIDPAALDYLSPKAAVIQSAPAYSDPWAAFRAQVDSAPAQEVSQALPNQVVQAPAFNLPTYTPMQNRKVDFKGWKPRVVSV